ncbi:MAG: AAA family ATPase [Oscillospiraceae bacterium]|nr:AAA family ATPase [Oscillospiraceae bacterium]
MKQLILISGPMGVGKTTAARELLNNLSRSVWLDGDWCWEQGNHWDFAPENKEMVMDNITYVLGNFLSNPNFETVIFSWVMHLPEIHEELLTRLENHDFDVFDISLVCSKDELKKRLAGRSDDEVQRAIGYLPLYDNLENVKLDTTGHSPARVVDDILRIINADAPRCIF